MSDEDYTSIMKAVYKQSADGCIALQKKVGNYSKDRAEIYLRNEEKIRKVLAEMPTSDEIRKLLEKVELDINDFYAFYGEEKIKNAVRYAKDLKDRYTVLWMNYDFFGIGRDL